MTGSTRIAMAFIYAVFLMAAPIVRSQNSSALNATVAADIPTLIRESKAASDKNWAAMIRRYSDYSLKRRRVLRKTNGNGDIDEESTLSEVYIPAHCRQRLGCRAVMILLEKDGKARPPERIEKDRLEAGKQLDKADRETIQQAELSQSAQANPNWMRFNVSYRHRVSTRNVKLDGQEILEKCDFSDPQRDRLGGRDTIVLNFAPRFGASFTEETAYMAKVEGKIWIDVQDKVIVRVAAWPRGKQFADSDSESLLENAAVGSSLIRTKEGIWFFRYGRINAEKYPDLFGERIDFKIEQFDYVSFRVEVDKAEVVPR